MARRRDQRVDKPRPGVTAPARPTPAAGGPGLIVIATVLAAGLLRLLAARGDLWLDEVWSLEMLAELPSAGAIFGLRHDNNHLLGSLLLWALRGFDSDLLLRLPAVLAGTAAVALGAAVAAHGGDARDGSPRARALLAALLLGSSHLLVHYGSEARGYGLVLGFGLLALFAAQRGELAPRSRWAALYGAACLLALLAHALAVHVLAGVLAWSLLRWWRTGLRGAMLLAAAATWHALPLAGAAALYLGFLRGLAVGGGPEEGVLPVLGRTVAYASGLPLSLGTGALALAGAGLLALGLWWQVTRDDDRWAFYLTAVLLSPLVVLLVQPGQLHFERYFVLSAALALLLAARLLAALAARGLEGAAVAGLLALVFCSAQAPRLERLLRDGRGQYRAALTGLLAADPAPRVYVSSDHDFRNGLMLRHYGPRLPGGERLAYVPAGSWTGLGPPWFLVHRFEGQPAPEPALADAAGNRYRLEAEYPSGPLSGWRWGVYRRLAAPSSQRPVQP